MSATHVVAGPDSDVGRLLQDVAGSPNVQFRLGSGDDLFIGWLWGQEPSSFGCHADQWWTTRTDHWVVMANFGAVRQVRFVREPDRHAPGHESLSIWLVGANGVSTLRAEFKALYDDQDRPNAAQFARWEELRAKYGGRDELQVENGAIVAER